jgi:hypothetical protein
MHAHLCDGIPKTRVAGRSGCKVIRSDHHDGMLEAASSTQPYVVDV